MHYGLGERLRAFHAGLEKILRLLVAELTMVAHIWNSVAALLWIPY